MILLNILNSFAPSAAIALIAWGALRLLRANAATRYGVWWAVLASVVAMVLWPQRAPIASIAPAVSVEPAKLDWVAWVVAAWAAFALYRTVRIVVGYVWLRRIMKQARPWSQPSIVLSDDAMTPFTAGFAKPVIVLPASFPEKLTDEEMQHVLLHEEAHIARRDQWANLLARVIGVFFGLHPVAALALARIERERERACDDWVVAATGEAKPYAASLTRVFELTRRCSQPDLASGFMGSRLGGRIEELLTQGRQFTRCASIPMLAVIVLPLAISAGLGLRAPAMVAYAQEKQPTEPAKPPTQALSRDAVADRLEALLTRLEAMLDRMNQPPPQVNAADALRAAELEQRLIHDQARQVEMKAREAQMQGQQHDLQQQLRALQRRLIELTLERPKEQ